MMLDELADCFDFAYLLSRGRLSLAKSPRGIFSKKNHAEAHFRLA